MAGAVGGHEEVIQLTLVDFLSGDVLQNCLVNPSDPIKDWREDITGINAVRMQESVARNRALHGWIAAREELWRFADKDTILIGQSVYHDLHVLHTHHAKIVDSAIITADAVLRNRSKIRKRWGLETLSRELLGIQIRNPSQTTGGNPTHDALEDALAARELVLLCALRPDRLEIWACATRKGFFKKTNNQRKRAPQRKARGQEEIERTLKWEDVVDYETWPKSPPDSD
ncbi:small RNA degrading nuclease 2 [Colletotrichum liriopes]|uniref:Small RNA degrading nuclease 2 n=1 Tax=Colletotrichum liriopes TaxID=708192 RepID=A0AA37LN77_9PEZI|nr:small RNA degrading nuclease 2 [Colletotrichum liriopes]